MRGTGSAATPGAHPKDTPLGSDVAGHSRVRRRGSIGIRLLLPIVVASIALLLANVFIVTTSINSATDAAKARLFTSATTASVNLVEEIEQEVAETNALVERGGEAGAQLLTAQRGRTDRALSEYLDVIGKAVAEAPGPLTRPAGHVTNLLNPFAKARAGVVGPDSTLFGSGDAFEQITQHLLDLAAAIAEQIKDPQLGNLARSAAVVSHIKHLGAQQRDLLRQAFQDRSLSRTDLIRLGRLVGDEQSRTTEFTHIASEATRRRYIQLFQGPDVDAATAQKDAVLRKGDLAALGVDADAWYTAQSGAMRLLGELDRELTDQLAATAERNQYSANLRALLAGGFATLVVLGTLAGGTMLAVRTTGRLRRLRQTAMTVARGELPTAVAQVATADSAESVRGAMSQSHRRVGVMLDKGRDEVAEVASALGVVHQQALRLAAEQALLRMEVSALFVALSRRGQSLVHRQLQLLDEFEQAEQNPDTLERLFVLDHLAARMRRNEENLLVLAGGEPGRRFEAPVVLTDVLRAAAGEIEEYARVDVPPAEDLWIAAHSVGDVVHLLAELLDNAASFSPPGSRVRVLVLRGPDSVTLSVVDSGIGMTPGQIAEANQRLSRPTSLTSTLVGTMGLLVVARLAVRRDVRVELRRGHEGGTIADVVLPATVLASAPPRTLPASVSRAVELISSPANAVATRSTPAQRTGTSAGAGTRPDRSAPAGVGGGPSTAEVPRPALPVVPAGAIAGNGGAVLANDGAAAANGDGSGNGGGGSANGGAGGASAVPVPHNGGPGSGDTLRLNAAGLPVRQPGTHGITTALATRGGDDPFLDPETVRARLSSLAGGIAAAQRRTDTPPGASHVG